MSSFRALLGLCLLVSACGGSPDTTAASGCADVVDVAADRDAAGLWTFSVTVRSADTGWEKYADAWEVTGPDATVLGTRELAHPHVDEQPFTRSLGGVSIPAGVGEVTVRARDSVAGFCGEVVVVELEP
jgi:hypothetical protein